MKTNITLGNEKLTFNKDILKHEIPILRVYRTEDSFYLFSCVDFFEYEYLAFKISVRRLIDLLEGKRSVYEVFTDIIESNYYKVTFNWDFDVESVETIKRDLIPFDYLPEKNTFLDFSNDEIIREYLEFLRENELIKISRSYYYEFFLENTLKYTQDYLYFGSSFRMIRSLRGIMRTLSCNQKVRLSLPVRTSWTIVNKPDNSSIKEVVLTTRSAIRRVNYGA